MTVIEALNTPHVAKLAVQDFIVLAEAGAFDQYAKAELIGGEIFVVNAQFRRHAAIRRQLTRRLEDALSVLPLGIGVADECNVDFGEGTMPQPDITLTTEPDGEGPIPQVTVRLIVEIADTTRDYDLGAKRELYARHGVAEYWVVDVKGSRILQMWRPHLEGYAEQREVVLGERIEAVTVVGLRVETKGLV